MTLIKGQMFMCNFGESLGVYMKFSLNTLNGSLCFAPAPTWVNLFSFPFFQYFLQRNECISVWYIGFIFIYLPSVVFRKATT